MQLRAGSLLCGHMQHNPQARWQFWVRESPLLNRQGSIIAVLYTEAVVFVLGLLIDTLNLDCFGFVLS